MMKVTIILVLFSLVFLPEAVFGEPVNLISQGDQAIKRGDLLGAENIFSEAVKQNSEGYRALKSQGEFEKV